MSTARKLKPQRLPKPVKKPEAPAQVLVVEEPVIIKRARELQIGVPEKKKVPKEKKPMKRNKALQIPREKGVKDIGSPKYSRDEILQKLNEAFSIGCTDVEACCYAGISPRLLYVLQNEIEDFVQIKEVLKAKPKLLARKTIFENLGTIETAKWLAERAIPDEFSLRPQVELTQVNVLTEERKAEIATATKAWSYTDPEEDELDSDYEINNA